MDKFVGFVFNKEFDFLYNFEYFLCIILVIFVSVWFFMWFVLFCNNNLIVDCILLLYSLFKIGDREFFRLRDLYVINDCFFLFKCGLSFGVWIFVWVNLFLFFFFDCFYLFEVLYMWIDEFFLENNVILFFGVIDFSFLLKK